MGNSLKQIHDTGNLAGTNRLEVLMFNLNNKQGAKSQLFGINVFKVKELLTVPPLLPIPISAPFMKGMANIRGDAVPVIDLMQYCGFEEDTLAKILILTEYNSRAQGFLIHEVDKIIQLAWSDVLAPPSIFSGIKSSVITGVSELEDNNTLLILDVEKILADVLGQSESFGYNNIAMASEGILEGKTVFFADDSPVARAQLESILSRLGANTMVSEDGQAAWDTLQKRAADAEAQNISLESTLHAIITDVEMPRMDGYTLTKRIKADLRFAKIPIIMHTSLSSESNKRLGENVGVDAYVAKLNPQEISDTLERYILG